MDHSVQSEKRKTLTKMLYIAVFFIELTIKKTGHLLLSVFRWFRGH